MEQPASLGMIMLKLSDNFQADQTDPTWSSLIAAIRTNICCLPDNEIRNSNTHQNPTYGK